MKRIFYNTLACCAALLSFAACEKTEELSDAGAGSGAILINISSGDMTRAEEGTFDFENRVDHLDVLIFDEDTGKKELHEHIQTSSTTGTGTVALTAKRSGFTANKRYWVYVIANANDAERTKFEEADFTKSDLLLLKREDPYIHLTGMPSHNSSEFVLPEAFLMDGVAYTEDTEPDALKAVVLYNGIEQDKTQLTVKLRRAAVKLELNLFPGTKTDKNGNVTRIKFLDPTGPESGSVGTVTGLIGGYYVRNMPYVTRLAAESTHEESYSYNEDVLLRTPLRTRNHYFDMHSSGPDLETDPTGNTRLIDKITVTAYTYANNWATASSTMEREPRWIVDIPLQYITPGGDPKDVLTCWTCYYQVLVCKGQALERNTHYTVNATVYAPGGTDPMQPVKLENIEYSVEDWVSKDISVGGEQNRPKFLTVNHTEMEIHETNVEMREINGTDVKYAIDNTTLEFASSSDVKAEFVKDDSDTPQVYYYNKFGLKTYVSKDILDQIKLTPDPGVSGNIKIESPVPTNNTIRYIEIKVTNSDEVEPRMVLIKQYPLTYITNIEGWYSYRDDFTSTASDGTTGVTTWELLAGKKIIKGDEYTSQQVPYNNDDAWICVCTWGYNKWSYYKTEGYDISGFFTSKAVKTYYANTGLSDFVNAYWEETRTGRRGNRKYTYDTNSNDNSGVDHLHNHRMYYVRITATSSDYTLGRPRITNGQTDSGVDNAKLVSPSFMLASQLGAVRAADNVDIAADHCKQYVEVALVRNSDGTFSSGTVYDDWRLPTEAEVNIIYKYQNDSEAMDLVLGGNQYWSASGLVPKPGETNHDDMAIRCIRDAYENPATDKSAEQEAQ